MSHRTRERHFAAPEPLDVGRPSPVTRRAIAVLATVASDPVGWGAPTGPELRRPTSRPARRVPRGSVTLGLILLVVLVVASRIGRLHIDVEFGRDGAAGGPEHGQPAGR
jgi:hypothetical protein